MHQRNHLELNWQHSPTLSDLPEKLGEWILHPGSFMDRLRHFGAKSPEVQLLHQSWQLPALNEKSILDMAESEQALIREVLIYSPGKKWMYARTVFPRKTLTGDESALSQLENRSLGSVLFNDPTIQRSPFDVVCLENS